MIMLPLSYPPFATFSPLPYNRPMTLSHILTDLRRDIGFMSNVAAWQILPARSAQVADFPDWLYPALRGGLKQRGIHQLYSHQRAALDGSAAGENVAVVTPTASGKTLCYNLPVLQRLLADPDATALYLFPTKALAHDQLEELEGWSAQIGGLPIATYDGDTPQSARSQIRRNARLLLTNPDMLHVGMLPYHGTWARFWAGLRVIVIDEMHVYRGVFGSHVANVLRRVRRIAAFYGSHPQVILTSATIANPRQLAESLIEAPVTLIEENGAPRGEKHIILYNPPLYDAARGLRRSSVLESQDLATRLLQGGVQSIVFGRARLTVEVILTYLRERLARLRGEDRLDLDPQMAVRGYRGGYLPAERRDIEAGLRAGNVRAVVATNALELGIDIGQLEAALICGYPGSIASTWQQMGRAGRTLGASLAILVATGGALDQYIISHPEYLLERSPEHALINADNLMLLVDQIRCAAFELPFRVGESFGQSSVTADVLALLAEAGEVGQHGERYLWQGEGYPAQRIGLRSSGGDTVLIQRRGPNGTQTVVGEVDVGSAPMLVHAGAVYIHEGQSYLVDALDLANHLAQVTPAAVDFYTDASAETQIDVLSIHDQRADPMATVAQGELAVTAQITGYRRVRHYTHETLGSYPLDYPPQTLETSGYWFEVTSAAQERLIGAGQWFDSPNNYGPNWAEQRQKVRERDQFRCQECGVAESPNNQHDVHHLIPFRTFGYAPGHNENYTLANRLSNLTLLCRRCHRRIEAGVRTRGGLDGLAYALQNLAPLYLMCDQGDLGVAVVREGEGAVRSDGPRIYIYERIAAGLGFSAQLYERHAELLAAAESLIRGCGCQHGCPACVGPVLLHEETARPLLQTKQLTLSLLAVLQDQEPDLPTPLPVADEIDFFN